MAPLHNVALIGSTGALAPFLLDALITSGRFSVTVLLRSASSLIERRAALEQKYGADGLRTVELPADFVGDRDGLAGALRGQDAVVMSIPASAAAEHRAVVDACVRVGVRRFVPADFGSVDSSDDVAVSTLPLYGQKRHMRDMLRGMSMMYPDFSWTSLVCGHFFDHGLETPLLGFDIHADPPRALIFDSGDALWSTSTRARIGEALVGALQREDESRNRMVYVQSFRTSQNEVLEVLRRVSGKEVEVTRVESEKYLREKKAQLERLEKGDGDGDVAEVTEQLVAVLGLTRADWTQNQDFVNNAWGLEEQDLESEVRKVWSTSKVQGN